MSIYNCPQQRNHEAIATYRALHKKRKYTKLYWDVANQIGIESALLIEIIEDWCNSNAENEKHGYFYQDQWWTSATYDEWAAMYPAMGKPRTLQRLLLKLESQNYVISTQPKKGADNTKFYRVNEEVIGLLLMGDKFIVPNPNSDQSPCQILTAIVPNPNSHSAKNEQSTIYKQINKTDQLNEDSPTPQSEFVQTELKNSPQPEIVEFKPEPLGQNQDPNPQQLNALLNQTESSAQTDNPNFETRVSGKFDILEQANKIARPCKSVTDEEIYCLFLEAYKAYKPSNFTEHRQFSSEHLKKIKHLLKDFPDTAIEIFTSALTWVREQDDGWWRQKQFSLSNLMTNGKIADYADKHATAMKYDTKYRLRVEGLAPSMDKGRFSVVDEDGNESTGAMADIARLYATDPMFKMLMDAGK
ncbi:hypothetical protein FNW02_36235 [Komarekiella sp. 'clone 1']|uniref:Replication protein n=1 Tax=Komarekiella delphini-convector SJRDD-AB1 TaxID=2593771 RepID=A0AA40VVH9_9NOST|nr:hypothetical protein [Komarekiella delphini-convector]MBD6621030.1 hypothetical protein [Komarekiella delphini-convector SJRDD-AB1]